jgi:hypothetical protein
LIWFLINQYRIPKIDLLNYGSTAQRSTRFILVNAWGVYWAIKLGWQDMMICPLCGHNKLRNYSKGQRYICTACRETFTNDSSRDYCPPEINFLNSWRDRTAKPWGFRMPKFKLSNLMNLRGDHLVNTCGQPLRLGRILFMVIFCLAIILRLGLGVVNDQANDDHMEVIEIIRTEKRIPKKDDCWQCYHSKLYHAFSAEIMDTFAISDRKWQIITAQMINVGSGIALVSIFWQFISSITDIPAIRLTTFSLAALNPSLIGINAQATNDSFVILFGALCIYALWLYVKHKKWWYALIGAMFATLAALSKGSGLILIVICLLTVAIVGIALIRYRRIRQQTLWILVLSTFMFFSTVPFLGSYYEHYKLYKDPLVINISKSPIPGLFSSEPGGRAGIRSIAEGFFTFMLPDLLQEPFVVIEGDSFGANRTSLWSQLYARFHSSRFEQWPASWQTREINVLNLTRLSIIFGLIPTLLFIWGIFLSLYSLAQKFAKHANKNQIKKPYSHEGLFLMVFFSFLLMIVKLNYDYRDFGTMKAIYVYPAFLTFIKFFRDGFTNIYLKLLARERLRLILVCAIAILPILYCIDIINLILHLTPEFQKRFA